MGSGAAEGPSLPGLPGVRYGDPMSPDFTPGLSALGGAIIGLAGSLVLLGQGRVAGITGIVDGVLHPRGGDFAWRVAFVAGLLIAGGGAAVVAPEMVSAATNRSPVMLVVAGLLVGFGTRLGSGCTSGHGVCGLSRLSARSLVSVLIFMAVGGVTAVIAGRLIAGAP